MAVRHRGFQRSSSKRGMTWGRSPADTVVTALGAATAVLDSTATPFPQGETITRVRGHIAIKSDQLAAGENVPGAVGMLLASDQAVAIGVGSIPTPYTDQDSDLWFMHQYFDYALQFGDATGFSAQGFAIFPFDSKAMRKAEEGQTLCVVVENGAAAFAMQYFLHYAVLFKAR